MPSSSFSLSSTIFMELFLHPLPTIIRQLTSSSIFTFFIISVSIFITITGYSRYIYKPTYPLNHSPTIKPHTRPVPISIMSGGRDLDSIHSRLLSPPPQPQQRRPCLIVLLPLTALLAVILLCQPRSNTVPPAHSPARHVPSSSRGAAAGVSEKSTSGMLGSGAAAYPWTNNMLAFQRTAFHFQPEKNWMNDPDGPLFYKGWYHLFYQYNPDSSVWGNITWGHAVSRDLINWVHLPIAMIPDRWYDFNGVWSGSATFLPDGRLVMLYTGSTHESVQVQNIAFPADPTDPLLLRWIKSDEHNPVISPPEGIHFKDFRDPTTAWHSAYDSGSWLLAIGSKNDSAAHAGMALVYRTRDFVDYELVPGVLHSVTGTGMWECVDFYPVDTAASFGLDTLAANAPAVRHVLKVSLDDDKCDYYAIGRYSAENNSWTPDDPDLDIGVGFRLDYGKYYASKSFYDQNKRRRVLWGWSGETDSERTDMLRGWASVQTIPRTVLFDVETGSNLLLWPVEELDTLRFAGKNFTNLPLPAGSVKPLEFAGTTQLDIMAEFEIDESSVKATVEADVGYNCSTSGGAAGRGTLGPFGLLVLADSVRSEQTAVYFYVAKGVDGQLKTYFCHDELRSSNANDIVKRIYGSTVTVLRGEVLTVRILIDHSIVESFAQGGRTCITSRVYPTAVIDGAAKLFLFNNATSAAVTLKSLTVWKMRPALMQPLNHHLLRNLPL